MQVLAVALWFAVVGGLLASLWLIVRRSRRRARRIAEQLAGAIVPTTTPLIIGPNRKEHALTAILATILLANGVAAFVDGRVSVALPLTLAFAPLLAFAARKALQRRPELVVDGEGINFGLGEPIRWIDVQQVRLRERPTSYGVSRHELVLELRPGAAPPPGDHRFRRGQHGDSITLQLEMLSRNWNEVAVAVQDRFGSRLVMD
jgi:hypothetical protein